MEQKTSGQRRALGRGLQDLLNNESFFEFDELPDPIRAARISALTTELMNNLDERFHHVVFQAVNGFLKAGREETVQELGEQLNQLHSNRNKPIERKRRWYYLWVK
jgi:hypothetical protein